MYRFRCLGKTVKGDRCKNKFLTDKYSKELTCTVHKNQKVDFMYGRDLNGIKDISLIICKNIEDPKTFVSFSKVCRAFARAAHGINKEKKVEFFPYWPI